MNIGESTGNAVAIDSKRALTALHVDVKINTILTLRTMNGHKLNARVVFCAFSEHEFDIAVVELLPGEADFLHFVELARRPVIIGQYMTILGMKKNIHDDLGYYRATCQANFIDPSENSAIIQSDYTSHKGLSGAGIFVIIEDGQYHLVGVHVASHDETSAPPNKLQKNRTKKQLGDSVDSLSDDIHGHRAFTMICEAYRVPDLKSFLESVKKIDSAEVILQKKVESSLV